MLRQIWHFFFGGCLHAFKWEHVRYGNCLAQRGICSKCGYTKEKTVSNYETPRPATWTEGRPQ